MAEMIDGYIKPNETADVFDVNITPEPPKKNQFSIFYMFLALITVVALVGLGISLADAYGRGVASAQNRERLMKQCIDDGRKEYECIGMLRGKV